MSQRLPFTQKGIARAIKGVEAAGRFVVGVKPDGTLIVGDKPVDTASLVPANEQPSQPERTFGSYFNGDQGAN